MTLICEICSTTAPDTRWILSVKDGIDHAVCDVCFYTPEETPEPRDDDPRDEYCRDDEAEAEAGDADPLESWVNPQDDEEAA